MSSDADTNDTADATLVRALISNWAQAVREGDMDGVLADHSGDIVMFDVPPPSVGVRGIDAYRGTWPPFFEWQKAGATFDIESMEVTAGADVAFAPRCCAAGPRRSFDRTPRTAFD